MPPSSCSYPSRVQECCHDFITMLEAVLMSSKRTAASRCRQSLGCAGPCELYHTCCWFTILNNNAPGPRRLQMRETNSSTAATSLCRQKSVAECCVQASTKCSKDGQEGSNADDFQVISQRLNICISGFTINNTLKSRPNSHLKERETGAVHNTRIQHVVFWPKECNSHVTLSALSNLLDQCIFQMLLKSTSGCNVYMQQICSNHYGFAYAFYHVPPYDTET